MLTPTDPVKSTNLVEKFPSIQSVCELVDKFLVGCGRTAVIWRNGKEFFAARVSSIYRIIATGRTGPVGADKTDASLAVRLGGSPQTARVFSNHGFFGRAFFLLSLWGYP